MSFLHCTFTYTDNMLAIHFFHRTATISYAPEKITYKGSDVKKRAQTSKNMNMLLTLALKIFGDEKYGYKLT
jgi:hypothetical protein